jgi:hypothetical protein
MMAIFCTISMLTVWNFQCSDCVGFVMVAKFDEIGPSVLLCKLPEIQGLRTTKYF